MTPEQLALNAAQDARLVASAIASGPTEAVLKAAEASARRLAANLPDLMRELAVRRAAAREATKRARRDQSIIQRDAPRLAERKEAAVQREATDFRVPACGVMA